MVSKAIELLVLEKGFPERLKLADIDLDNLTELSYQVNALALQEGYWSGISTRYEFNMLAKNYVEGVSKLQQVVAEIVDGTEKQDQASMEKCTAHPFVYASPAAYQLVKPKVAKEKESDLEGDSVAHISWEAGPTHGIFVSLVDNYAYENILSSNIHEHGHYFHFILDPEHYNTCDTTMREAMAIFMEMKCQVPFNYAYAEPGKETPHHRAQKLLFALEQAKFYAAMDTKTQWKFLTCMHTHQNLQEITHAIVGKQPVPSLEEIIIIDVEE